MQGAAACRRCAPKRTRFTASRVGRTRGGRRFGLTVAEQVVDVLVSGLAAGDFYILCPDGDVTRSLDELRIQWAADDIIQTRPALSRWHPEYAAAFQAFVAAGGRKA